MRVIGGGYCIGCGACAVGDDPAFQIRWNEFSEYEAIPRERQLPAKSLAVASSICPFSDGALDEDTLAASLFSAACRPHNKIGYYLRTAVGYVSEGNYRTEGSSGGMVSWLAAELLRQKLVDGVIHVKPVARRSPSEPLFRMAISRTEREVREGAKSRYFPIEMTAVLTEVKKIPGRYALVGLPCFVKAVRLLARQDDCVKERVAFLIGLFCGHLKSGSFADLLAWQMGIDPGDLCRVDFRRKVAGRRADDYVVSVESARRPDQGPREAEWRGLFGSNWGQGLLKYRACDYCDDVVAETADVSIGDAWLPRYVEDHRGTNVIVLRNPLLQTIVEQAVASGRIHLEDITADEVAQSQDAGLRHRREGLAYRLLLKEREGAWHPPKRVSSASVQLTRRQMKVQECRVELAAKSRLAFRQASASGQFQMFLDAMSPLVRRYERLYRAPWWRRVGSRIRRFLNGLIG